MTERELLTKFIDYIYFTENKSNWYLAIGNFLEENPERRLWTTEYPTVPGYYWLRNAKLKRGPESIPDPLIVEVDEDLYFYPDKSNLPYFTSDVISAEWRGPIHPPEAEQEGEGK